MTSCCHADCTHAGAGQQCCWQSGGRDLKLCNSDRQHDWEGSSFQVIVRMMHGKWEISGAQIAYLSWLTGTAPAETQ